jgi:hypothetical protein
MAPISSCNSPAIYFHSQAATTSIAYVSRWKNLSALEGRWRREGYRGGGEEGRPGKAGRDDGIGDCWMTDINPTIDNDIPTHPEEMKANYNLRIGKCISLQASARITPAGIVTIGVTTLLVALAFVALTPRHRR